MREKQRDNPLLPLNSGRINQVASTGTKYCTLRNIVSTFVSLFCDLFHMQVCDITLTLLVIVYSFSQS